MTKARDIADGTRYVDVTGDTMSGNLKVQVFGNATSSVQYGTGLEAKLNAFAGETALELPAPSTLFKVRGKAGAIDTMTLGATYSGTEREGIVLDYLGRVTMPYQPCFRATRSTGSQAFGGFTTLIYDVVRLNTGNHYNSSTGVFTAPVGGAYAFSFNYYTDDNTSEMVDLVLNDSTIIGRTELRVNLGNNSVISSGMIIYYLNANDNVRVKNTNTGVAELIGGVDYNFFNGFLIG